MHDELHCAGCPGPSQVTPEIFCLSVATHPVRLGLSSERRTVSICLLLRSLLLAASLRAKIINIVITDLLSALM